MVLACHFNRTLSSNTLSSFVSEAASGQNGKFIMPSRNES